MGTTWWAEGLSEVSDALSPLSIPMLIAYVLCLFILSQLLFLPRVFVFVVLSFCFLFNSMPSHDSRSSTLTQEATWPLHKQAGHRQACSFDNSTWFWLLIICQIKYRIETAWPLHKQRQRQEQNWLCAIVTRDNTHIAKCTDGQVCYFINLNPAIVQELRFHCYQISETDY